MKQEEKKPSKNDYLSVEKVISSIESVASTIYAEKARGYFKTGPGEYGEGDVFWGVRNPQARAIAKQSMDLALDQIATLLAHPVHEVRLVGVLVLVGQYQKAKIEAKKQEIYEFYCTQFHRINNWDLVDLSAHYIVGNYCETHGTKILYQWVKSNHLWTRRIAVVSCLYLIKKDRFEEILDFCKTLKNDPEPLMHKACGWMLRELGKRNVNLLRKFLNEWGTQLPRTTVRYAIERFKENERLELLQKTKRKE